jgi:hypothetical protein
MAGHVSATNGGEISSRTLPPERKMTVLFLQIINWGYNRLSIFITFHTHIHHQFGTNSVSGQILHDKLAVFQDPIKA